MATVRVKGLSKVFGEVEAVRNVDLEIKEKEFVVLLGPSGCGKTTTLRMIAGLETPTAGEIFFDGNLVNDVPPDKRNVAMVFQTSSLYPHMTVFDNIAFCLRNRKLPEDETNRKTMRTMEILEIEDLKDRYPHQLSGGQQQRVAVARALVRDPTIFLMDEPLANLDARLKETTRSEFKKLHERIRGTFLYVTHDQIEAITLAQRVAVMKDGMIQQIGTPEDIYNRPANEFVASFVGTPPMNIIPGTVRRAGRRLDFVCEDFEVKLPPKFSSKLGEEFEGKPMKLGVRPRDVVLSSKREIDGEVYTVELLGEEQKIVLKVGVLLLTCVVSKTLALDVEQKVGLSFTDDVFLFDASTATNVMPD
ncbi:MAG: ABC transporter ATP-binding protein [Candidatus Geothermarchaeales archaeon]